MPIVSIQGLRVLYNFVSFSRWYFFRLNLVAMGCIRYHLSLNLLLMPLIDYQIQCDCAPSTVCCAAAEENVLMNTILLVACAPHNDAACERMYMSQVLSLVL